MLILAFVVYTALCYWVVFMDGAETIEGWGAFFLFGWIAASLTSRDMKSYVAMSWVVALLVLIYKLVVSDPLASA